MSYLSLAIDFSQPVAGFDGFTSAIPSRSRRQFLLGLCRDTNIEARLLCGASSQWCSVN